MGIIGSYYKFKIDFDEQSQTYKFIKIIRRGSSSPFDNIYNDGVITECNTVQATNFDDKFYNLHIKFKIQDDTSKLPNTYVFYGLKGNAQILKNQQLRYHVIYRIPESNVYEVIVINRDRSTNVSYSAKLKKGELDKEIERMLNR